MRLGRVLRAALLASGTVVLVAGALALGAKNKKARSGIAQPKLCCTPTAAATIASSATREYFRITRVRSKTGSQKWALEGFGRYQCFLLFDSWAQAMEQATFRLERLNAEEPELVSIRR